MKKIYYPGHEERYAHIPKRLRKLYPDEIHIGHPPLVLVVKRNKPIREVTGDDVRKYGVLAAMIANDVPYTEGLHDG